MATGLPLSAQARGCSVNVGLFLSKSQGLVMFFKGSFTFFIVP